MLRYEEFIGVDLLLEGVLILKEAHLGPHTTLNACLSSLFGALMLYASALVTEYKNDAISGGV